MACDGGRANGCANLAGMYQDGTGVEKDQAQAAILNRKACDGEASTACASLGLQYDNGEGVNKD